MHAGSTPLWDKRHRVIWGAWRSLWCQYKVILLASLTVESDSGAHSLTTSSSVRLLDKRVLSTNAWVRGISVGSGQVSFNLSAVITDTSPEFKGLILCTSAGQM